MYHLVCILTKIIIINTTSGGVLFTCAVTKLYNNSWMAVSKCGYFYSANIPPNSKVDNSTHTVQMDACIVKQ